MAAPAIRAELAVMDVVGAVAVRATTAEAHLLLQRPSMAVVAGDVDVCPEQGERRLRIVIESPGRPADRVMTLAAVVAEPAAVVVILAMTVAACRRCVFEDLRNVTGIALLLGVPAKQRKRGQIVIEEHVLSPSQFTMAIGARRSLRAVMRIIRRVAGIAAGIKWRVENRFDMTRFAGRRGVLAQQFMARVTGMLETDVRPFGRCMTGLAGLTEMTVMVVVVGMAADTLRRQSVGKGFIAVAIATRQVRMRAVQSESRIARMVE